MEDPDHWQKMMAALLASEAMDENRRYLERGRRLAALEPSKLKELWTAAFKKWFATREAADSQALDDAAAELRLREMELPNETVQHELDLARLEIFRNGPEQHRRNIMPKIAAFLEEMDRDRN